MYQGPLVSVIIPTKNSEGTIEATLRSVKAQTYKNIEVIIVDSFSKDRTIELARSILPTVRVVTTGLERSTQKNFGAKMAKGKYLYFVDSDFILEPSVVFEAVQICEKGYDAVVIHNTSHPAISYWSQVRKLERDCYYLDPKHVAARFMRKDIFMKVGGYDEGLIAGEDYDLHLRLLLTGAKIGWCKSIEYHIGEPKTLNEIIVKHIYYGKYILNYIRKNFMIRLLQLSPFRRSYVRNIRAFITQPKLLLGFIIYQYVRYASALAGLLSSASFPSVLRSHLPFVSPEEVPKLVSKVSAVIVTRNRPDECKNCIESLQSGLKNGLELILVDDCSTVPYPDLSSLYNLKIIKNTKRMFLNASRNIGASFTFKPYILFIDDDNFVDQGAIATLAKVLDTFEFVAVACPVILAKDGQVWYAGGWMSPLSGIAMFNFRGWPPQLLPKRLMETELFHSCFMVKRELMEKVGGFDSKNFPMYLGEADFYERLKKLGFKAVVHPHAMVIHKIHSNGVKGILRNIHIIEPVRAYFVARNRTLFIRKHRSTLNYMFFLLFFLPIIAFIHIITILASKGGGYKWTHLVGPYIRGLLDGIIGNVRFGRRLMIKA